MKITDAYSQFSPTQATSAAQGAKPVGKHGGAGVHHKKDDSAKVDVSDAAKALEEKAAASATKVERLRASIKDGSFKVDADKIAQKLMGEDES